MKIILSNPIFAKMVLKISYKKLLKPLNRLVLTVASIMFAGFAYARGYDKTLLPGFLIIISIPTIPTLYLLIEYLIITKRQEIKLIGDEIEVKYRNGEFYQCKISNVEIVKLFKSAGMEEGSFPYQTAEMYYHAEIFTYDSKKMIITSIVNPDIEMIIDNFKKLNINVEVIRTIYSTIYI